MRLTLISSQPITYLFGKEFPFAGINCTIREALSPNDLKTSDCIIDLTVEENPHLIDQYRNTTTPVLIGSVVLTLKEWGLDAKLPIARFNHWPTFANRNCIEFAVSDDQIENFQSLFQALHIPWFRTADHSGFVSAKTVSMIINEAFLSIEEEVATEAATDTAMKFGTNYPMGPFEWCNAIGINRIKALLQNLAKEDKRYQPASPIIKTIKN